MKTSADRILTTHVGSLPRNEAVTEGVFAQEEGTLEDEAAFARTISDAVDEVDRADEVRAPPSSE